MIKKWIVFSGQMSIHNTSVPSHQLYNYIISHNEMYGMKVFRMNSPISAEDDIELVLNPNFFAFAFIRKLMIFFVV